MQQAKGTKDYNVEEKRKRNEIVRTIKNNFQLFSFNEIETPILERYETLAIKQGAGQESDIIKETFKLKDQGNRKLGLRFEITTSLARFISENPQLKLPFKTFQIGKVFRDGPIKKGRLREFLQCDADIIGTKSILAEAELLNLTKSIFKNLNLNITLKVNDRKILNAILDSLKIKDKESIILTIDKLEKLGWSYVEKELITKKVNKEQIKKIKQIILIKGSNQEKLKKLAKFIDPEILKDMKELIKLVKNLDFDVSLARGLGYYTGIVFEGFSKKLNASVCGGGRYDNLISSFTKKEYPATGISFGIDAISTVYDKDIKTKTKIYIIPIKTIKESLKIAETLRNNNIETDIDIMERGISKNLDYADKLKIPFTLFIGNKELKVKKVKLRDMKTGKERLLKIEEVLKLF